MLCVAAHKSPAPKITVCNFCGHNVIAGRRSKYAKAIARLDLGNRNSCGSGLLAGCAGCNFCDYRVSRVYGICSAVFAG